MIHVPDDNLDAVFENPAQPPFTDGFYILITGAQAGISFKIEISYVL